ncbi:PREDICTED: farnesol dehydrogenase [Rhagoletis zephyria]|uniref:farnesol dehydrogenase n=1 Tax=Rhagoletis zephyria TaxID=28612 RepID=UPI0008116D0F|nr:PREDICTED: farnesol dehydrogenase [Rhagoletis zephyria]
MERWQGKVAMVTGASSGIGAACAKALVCAGCVVVGLARRQERIAQLQQELPTRVRSNLHSYKCDITREESVRDAFKWTEQRLGAGVDILVNNAGIIATTELSRAQNTNEIRATIDTNLLGTIFCTREAFNSMRERNIEGHVVIINSVAGLQVPNLGPDLPSLNIYPATKFALRAMNEIYRQEFQRHKTRVRITTISPGIVDTDILPSPIRSVVKEMLPSLKSEDVADAVLWAISTPSNVQVHNITIKPMGEKF